MAEVEVPCRENQVVWQHLPALSAGDRKAITEQWCNTEQVLAVGVLHTEQVCCIIKEAREPAGCWDVASVVVWWLDLGRGIREKGAAPTACAWRNKWVARMCLAGV